MMQHVSGVAIALENNCALQIYNDTYRIIKSNKKAQAYKTYWNDQDYHEDIIECKKKYLLLKELLQK